MARPKRQEKRRGELVAAAQRTIVRHGPDGARLHRVAEEAGLTSGAVLYYYPDIDDLVLEANRAGMERFYDERVAMLAEYADDPVGALVRLVRTGLPVGPDDTEVRLLCELGGSAGRDPLMAEMLTTLFDRQVGMYREVLDAGEAKGLFTVTPDATTVARNLVALEDAYGYRIVARHPVVDAEVGAELILAYARQATGHPLTT